MKKVMMIIIALASYTQERAKGSKTMGGNTKKQVQAKNQEQNHKNVWWWWKGLAHLKPMLVSLQQWHKCAHTHKTQVVYKQC